MNELIIVTLVATLLSIFSAVCGLVFNIILTRKKQLKEKNKEIAKSTNKHINQIYLQMNKAIVFSCEYKSILDTPDIEQIKIEDAYCRMRTGDNKKMKYTAYEIYADKSKKKSKAITNNTIKTYERYNLEKEFQSA